MTDRELDLVTTDDLVSELARRFHAVVVAVAADITRRDEQVTVYGRGGHAATVGLAQIALRRFLSKDDSIHEEIE